MLKKSKIGCKLAYIYYST